MEFNKTELKEVSKIIDQADVSIKELAELELVTVGGGCGEVVFY